MNGVVGQVLHAQERWLDNASDSLRYSLPTD